MVTQSISLDVNGRTVHLTIDDLAMPLLYALRNDLGLHGPCFGCGLAQCGVCTAHLDGAAIRSCVFPGVACDCAPCRFRRKKLSMQSTGAPDGHFRRSTLLIRSLAPMRTP